MIDLKVKENFDTLGIRHELKDKVLTIHTSEVSAGRLWASGAPKKNAGETDTFNDGSNTFSGSSTKEWGAAINGEKINMSLFLSAKAKNKVLADKLNTALAMVKPMRKRRFSETDGEYCLDRRFDLAPFASTYRTNAGASRSIAINADFSLSANNSAESIARYGSFIYGIVSALEENGVTCEINLRMSSNCTVYPETGGDAPFDNLILNIKVKNCGEYISEERLARAFHVSQYRRNGFSLLNHCPALYSCRIESGLGKPIAPKWENTAELGALFFKPNDAQSLSPEKVLENVYKSLGINQ